MDASTLQLATLPLWGLAAYLDHRTRHAPNILWLLLCVMGIATLAVEASMWLAAVAFFSLMLITPLALWLWHSGRVGGADAKALMVLPLCYPVLLFQIVVMMGAFTAAWLPLRNADRGVPLLVPLAAAVTAAVVLW